MEVELVRATRGMEGSSNGLITFKVKIPLYIWVELLTHRRAVRNASSARAMSTTRYVDMGHYTPSTFYQKGNGMQATDNPIKHQWLARLIWHTSFMLDVWAAKALEYLGVAKEQRNRVIAPYKYIAGMVTMTEGGWEHFLSLRTAPNADKAMQELAQHIKDKIGDLYCSNPNLINQWVYDDWHIPYDPGREAGDFKTRAKIAAARISRLSYNRIEGKDDIKSAEKLITDQHLSPLEHIAVFKMRPKLSALFCKKEDSYHRGVFVDSWQGGYGWETFRSVYE